MEKNQVERDTIWEKKNKKNLQTNGGSTWADPRTQSCVSTRRWACRWTVGGRVGRIIFLCMQVERRVFLHLVWMSSPAQCFWFAAWITYLIWGTSAFLGLLQVIWTAAGVFFFKVFLLEKRTVSKRWSCSMCCSLFNVEAVLTALLWEDLQLFRLTGWCRYKMCKCQMRDMMMDGWIVIIVYLLFPVPKCLAVGWCFYLLCQISDKYLNTSIALTFSIKSDLFFPMKM